ncbi:MAG: hypothetical protein Q9195_007372 [Heterodermia aff. obscurata]
MAATPPTVDPQNFANNAFTNLAPLLTLFGDELTKQFLSTTFGWMDIILLGIAPIGIPTVIVCAIRVGGNGFLKSIVGRDDEKKELLSSTSSNIREIWDGARVIRQTGEKVSEFFVFDPNCPVEPESKIISPLEKEPRYALTTRTIETIRWGDFGWFKYEKSSLLKGSITPSLSLNNPKAIPSTAKTLSALCLGIVIQATVISINALIVYKWHKLRAKRLVAPWAFPVWLAGTVAISVGVSTCAYVVVCKTRNLTLKPIDENGFDGNGHLQIFRVQKALDKEGIPALLLSSTNYPQLQLSSDRKADDRIADVIIKSWGQLEDLHDNDDLKEPTDLADSLATATSWLLDCLMPKQDELPFRWSHMMCLGTPTVYEDSVHTVPGRKVLTVHVFFESGSNAIRDRVKAVLKFSNELEFNAQANKTDGALQIIGSIEVKNVAVAQRLSSFFQRRVRFWDPSECGDLSLDVYDHRPKALYELFGLEFSSLRFDTLTAPRTNPEYCDLVVDIDASEAHRNRQMTIQLFISFLNEVAAQKNNQLTTFLGQENAIDKIGNKLVELKICKDLHEARVPIFSVLWSHNLVSLQDISSLPDDQKHKA